jgi:hypothetical protein
MLQNISNPCPSANSGNDPEIYLSLELLILRVQFKAGFAN